MNDQSNQTHTATKSTIWKPFSAMTVVTEAHARGLTIEPVYPKTATGSIFRFARSVGIKMSEPLVVA